MDVFSANELARGQCHSVSSSASSPLWWFTSVSRSFQTDSLCPLCSHCCRLTVFCLTARECARQTDRKRQTQGISTRDSEGGRSCLFVHYSKDNMPAFSPPHASWNSFIRYVLCLFKNKLAGFLRLSLSSCSWLTLVTFSITVYTVSVAAVAHSA